MNGFTAMRLWGLRADWDDSGIDNLIDSFGQEWVRALTMYFEEFIGNRMRGRLIALRKSAIR